jgi:hypothetical protein
MKAARESVMMRWSLALCLLAVAPLASAGTRPLSGSWTASVDDKRNDRLDFSMRTSRHENNGTRLAIADFTGLTGSQARSPSAVDVQFTLEREPGTITFQGSFRNGEGAGTFTFAGNEAYANTLRKLGLELGDKDRDPEHVLFTLTIFDVSSSFIRSMQSIGYDLPLEKYIEFRIFSVDPAYVRDMASVGFDHLTADKLVETRVHGATPDYIRQMRKAGEDLPLDKYIESRIFQITPEFAAEMGRAGYPNLSRDELVQFKIQGVTAEFISDLKQLGYTRIPAEKLVEMRIHGVTPEWIRRLETAGYKHVPIDKMVQMRIFDIQPEMIKALDDAKGGT